MKVWIAGRVIEWTDGDHAAWELHGVFDSKDKAVAACRTKQDFIGAVELNTVAPEASVDLPESEYPLL
jgi:hypothetical protein